jgi:hypothetical protein
MKIQDVAWPAGFSDIALQPAVPPPLRREALRAPRRLIGQNPAVSDFLKSCARAARSCCSRNNLKDGFIKSSRDAILAGSPSCLRRAMAASL